MTLFNADTKIQTPQVETPSEGETYLSKLVGEGKKFKDNEALAKAKAESDAHIATLEAEAALQREEIGKRATLEEFLDKIESRARTNNQQPVGEVDGTQVNAQLSKDEVRALVKQATLEERNQATQDQNWIATAQELQKAWGQNWQRTLISKQEELGLSQEFMNSIAAKSPKALLNLVGLGNTANARSIPNSDLPPRTQMANASGKDSSAVKNKAYWDKMQKTDPILYRSSPMTAERHRMAQSMGRSFFE